jgi:hypothetical protein
MDKSPIVIKIGAVDYDVFLVDDMDEDYGYCVPHMQKIVLSKNQSYQSVTDTLLHEVLHAIWHESGLFDIKKPSEEQIVRTISTWLCVVFRDNPKLLEIIQDSKPHWPHIPFEGEVKRVKR